MGCFVRLINNFHFKREGKWQKTNNTLKKEPKKNQNDKHNINIINKNNYKECEARMKIHCKMHAKEHINIYNTYYTKTIFAKRGFN